MTRGGLQIYMPLRRWWTQPLDPAAPQPIESSANEGVDEDDLSVYSGQGLEDPKGQPGAATVVSKLVICKMILIGWKKRELKEG